MGQDEGFMLQQERERMLEEALDEAYEKGLSAEALQTLIYETGSRWHPKQEVVHG